MFGLALRYFPEALRRNVEKHDGHLCVCETCMQSQIRACASDMAVALMAVRGETEPTDEKLDALVLSLLTGALTDEAVMLDVPKEAIIAPLNAAWATSAEMVARAKRDGRPLQ